MIIRTGGDRKCKYYNGCGSTENCKRCDEIRKKYKNKNENNLKGKGVK